MAFPTRSGRLRSALQRAGQFGVYAGFRVFESGLRLLPLTVVFHLGRFGGLMVWAVSPSYRRLVRRNVDIAFARDKTDAERTTLVRSHFTTLGANLLSSLKMPAMRPEEIARVVELTGSEHIAAGLARGRGVIYAIAHLGNWEVLAQMPAFGPGTKGAALFQPLGNPFLNRHLKKTRSRLGFQLFDRSAGFHAPAQHLRENGVLGVLVDQHAGDGGVWTPLFRRLASTTTLAALLSLRTGAPILPLGVVTTGVARWKAVVGPPITSGKSDAQALSAEMNRLLEDLVRQSPADWFWVHDRWKTPRPHFLLAGYKRGLEFPAGMSLPELQPFELLVRTPNWLGDVCMALPTVRALKRGRPDARVTVLTLASLADFWRAVPEVDAVITKEPKDGIFAVRKAIRAASVRFDVAVLLVESPRSALEVRGCGIPRVVGARGRWRKWLLNQIVPAGPPGPIRHHVHDFLQIAENCGATIDDPALLAPLPHPASAPVGTPRISLTLCAGAEYGPAKRWPLEKFAETALAVQEKTGVEWTLVGAPSETALGAQLADRMHGQCRNLVGQTTLPQLMVELAASSLLLTNDTGTMHLAAALGVPVVAVFGSTEPAWTGPPGPGHTTIRHHVDCSPCFLRECPRKTERYRCFESITPDSVAQVVMDKLRAD